MGDPALIAALDELRGRMNAAEDMVSVWAASEDRPELQSLRGELCIPYQS